MKFLYRIIIFLVLCTLILNIGVVVSADSIGAGTVGSTTGVLTTPTSVVFLNTVKVFNPDEVTVSSPEVTYSFQIEPQATTDNITDSTPITVRAKTGVGTPVITASKTTYLNTENLTADTLGYDNSENVTVDFSSVTFTAPGVYRYKITRTVTDVNSVLIQDTDGNIRYLDVYVREENGVRIIYGYALHLTNGSNITTSTVKSSGFKDEYHTSNLTLSMTLINDITNNSHQFPLTVMFTGTKNARIITSSTGNATVSDVPAGTSTSSPSIAHNSSVKYIGIPDGFTVDVYETNDVIGTSYISEGTGDIPAASKIIDWVTGTTSQSNTASTASSVDEGKTISFTNTLALISPTGVVLRTAPYLVMLGFGILILLVSKKHEKEEVYTF